MTKTSETLVTFLLDRSGSMQSIKTDTIGAFNAYLGELKKGKITFSFLQFDSQSIDTVVKNVPIKNVPNLTDATFQPRGMTPLVDAAYKTIKAVEDALSRRDDSPKVVICFQTDGQENCSREHTMAELNDLIKAKTALGWQFNFMGASIDAYAQAGAMGISHMGTMSYDSHSEEKTRGGFVASAVNTVAFASGARGSTMYTSGQKMAAGDVFDPLLKTVKAAKPGARKKAIVDDVKL